MKQPIPKKIYETKLQKKLEDFEVFYRNYLRPKGGCSDIHTIRNSRSRVDFIISSGVSSGETSIVSEWKTRNKDISVAQYNYCMAEQDKIENGLKIAHLLNCHFYFWAEYKEAIVGWYIDPTKTYEPDVLNCPVSHYSSIKKDKDVFKLYFNEADVIVAKKDYSKATVNQLMKLIFLKKIEQVEAMRSVQDPKIIESEINYFKSEIEKL